MRNALQQLCRWIGSFRAARAPARSRLSVFLSVDSLEERIAMASLLDALPASGQTVLAGPAFTSMMFTSAGPTSDAVDWQSAAFRIRRTPADAIPLQVAFVQTAYGPTGAVGQEGIASFAPGFACVEMPLARALHQPANSREIVTLTLRG